MFPKPLLALVAASSTLAVAAPAELRLWYRQPAVQWEEALPVGNGRLGAMVFGGIGKERIQFNESTVWTGEPHDYAHPGAYKYLAQLRQLLFDGKQAEAEKLAMDVFMSEPIRQKAYQAFADLNLEFPAISDAANYRRELDLDNAIASTQYVASGVTYRREVFSSWPAQAIIVRITASQPGRITLNASFKSAHQDSQLTGISDRELSLSGPVEDSAIRYEARLLAQPEGGSVTHKDGAIAITSANAVTLILTGATNFKNFRDVSADPKSRDEQTLAPLRKASYDSLRAAHVADYQKLYGRVSMDLGVTAAAEMPTDERIKAFARGNDPQLVAMVFQYGRYLLISSSRAGGQPATLQGLWNDSNHPAWDSKYTVNINTEMNYWPAEVAAIGECSQALFDALKDLAISGARTAKEEYNARGWVLHHNFDLWRGTAPINASNHGIWQTGGAWLSQALWDHYLFTHDRAFLADTAYPLMKGAALFFVDSLVQYPGKDWLVTGPSNSPEHGGLVMGPTMDHQIVRGLFEDVIAASAILNVDADLRAQLTDMRKRIAPDQIGKHGQLQEWLQDLDDPTDHHRHVSHLWGVFPGREITSLGTPDLFAAAQKSLEFRGDEATGWSMGWKVNLWARFLDGAHAYRILQNLITPASNGDRARHIPSHAGLFANMFDAHPPFQIDGNFGAASGIAEMLLQSDDWHATPTSLTDVQLGKAAQLNLLPALPPQIANGEVKGLVARGALTVDLAWHDGQLTHATIRARDAEPVQVRYHGKEVMLQAKAGGVYQFGPDLAR
jgi:alpha-L-fucosidase 2